MTKKRIIFVDDESKVIDGLRRMLHKQRDEWDMRFVLSGADALAEMAQAPFDVIVTDMRMPGMSGDVLLEKVASQYPDTARIVLTGYVSGEPAARSLKFAHLFLAKPTDAETLKQAVTRSCAAQQSVENERMRLMVASCEKLPTLPALYVEINKAAESESASARQIAKVISRDMSMSAKLLQMVNSSFFGIGRRVSSIEQTVALLGIVRIKALVLSESLFKQFASLRTFPGFSADALWDHSLQVGEVARLISKEEKQPGERADQAFTAGIMHDIGKLLLASQQAEVFEGVLRVAQASRKPLWQVETEVLGASHAQIGGYLLDLWGLPPRIVEAVSLHHTPGDLSYDGLCALTAVHVADVLASEPEHPETGGEGNALVPSVDMAYLERTGLVSRLERWKELAINARGQAMETPA